MVQRPWIGPDMELRTFEDQSMHVPHACILTDFLVRPIEILVSGA